jgi:hypothetical protein
LLQLLAQCCQLTLEAGAQASGDVHQLAHDRCEASVALTQLTKLGAQLAHVAFSLLQAIAQLLDLAAHLALQALAALLSLDAQLLLGVLTLLGAAHIRFALHQLLSDALTLATDLL